MTHVTEVPSDVRELNVDELDLVCGGHFAGGSFEYVNGSGQVYGSGYAGTDYASSYISGSLTPTRTDRTAYLYLSAYAGG